tara:strand:- start:5751 stop:6338 length:588 start_codon:yes stop_codon:yes gene_type:complete
MLLLSCGGGNNISTTGTKISTPINKYSSNEEKQTITFSDKVTESEQKEAKDFWSKFRTAFDDVVDYAGDRAINVASTKSKSLVDYIEKVALDDKEFKKFKEWSFSMFSSEENVDKAFASWKKVVEANKDNSSYPKIGKLDADVETWIAYINWAKKEQINDSGKPELVYLSKFASFLDSEIGYPWSSEELEELFEE